MDYQLDSRHVFKNCINRSVHLYKSQKFPDNAISITTNTKSFILGNNKFWLGLTNNEKITTQRTHTMFGYEVVDIDNNSTHVQRMFNAEAWLKILKLYMYDKSGQPFPDWLNRAMNSLINYSLVE